MCVIATAEKGSMPTIDQLTRMSETNPDGAGIAWHDGNGLHRVRHSDNGKTLAFITEHWNELKATPCLIHFRLATHGAVNTENTHPFRYTLGNDEHEYIAHNGIAQKHTNGRNPRKIRQNRPERTNPMAHATPDHRRLGRRTHTGVQHPMAGHHLGRMAHGIRRRLHRRLERRIRSRHKRHAQRRHRHHHRHTPPPLEDQTTRRQGAEERDTHPPPPTAGTEKHERTTAGEPPAPPHPHVRHARNPAGLRPPQAGTEDGEGRNVRRSPACNRRRDTARRTFRPSPSGEQAND